MATHLLTWNPLKSEWSDFQEDWDNFNLGFQTQLRWSCGNSKQITTNDRVFLMRLGKQKPTGIVASGTVQTSAYADENWNREAVSTTAMYIEFEMDALLHPKHQSLLQPEFASVEFNWHPQRSGVRIPDEVAARLEELWKQHVSQVLDDAHPATQSQNALFVEGMRKPSSSVRFERDPNARKACISHYGTQCVVCGYDFGRMFGELGKGYIHVHHLVPMSERDGEYLIDPIHDMRPVCPNCHAMLHRYSPPLSIEELREILHRN